MASLKRVKEVLDTEIDLTDEHAHKNPHRLLRESGVSHCLFPILPDDLVLDHINFTANPVRPLVLSVRPEAARHLRFS